MYKVVGFEKIVFIIICWGLMFQVNGQQKRKKENRQAAIEYAYKMYRNPSSGKIPFNIRKKELSFAQKTDSKFSDRTQAVSNNWEVRGPYNQGGRTKAIAIDSRNEDIIFAGGTSGGLFRTINGGTSWSQVSKSLDNPSVTGVAQDPLDRDTWYYITGESAESVNTNQSSQIYVGDGVFKSTDNGITWAQLASTNPSSTLEGKGENVDWQLCNEIVVDPVSSAVLIANNGGVYRSVDKGITWSKVIDAKGLAEFGDVTHIDVASVGTDSRIFYVSTHSSGTDAGFFTSTDGENWTKLTNPSGFDGEWERIVVDIAPSNTNVVWFLAFGGQLSPQSVQLLKYDQSTMSWTNLTSKIPSLGGDVGDFSTQQGYNMVMAVKPDNENVVFIADLNLWRSTDGFASDALSTNTGNTQWIGGYSPDNDVDGYPNHHSDVHEMVFFPNDPNKVLSGHDGGLSVTTNIMANDGTPSGKEKPHPVTWSSLNNGLFTTQAYAISIDPSTSGSKTILAGFQDNTNYRTTSGGANTNWTVEPYGGDGAWNATAPGGDVWYISQQNGSIQRNSTNELEGPGVNPSAAGKESTNTFISPFILDRNDFDIMYYAAKADLWRNSDISTIAGNEDQFDGTAEGWDRLTFSGATIDGNITALETSIVPANTLYLGTESGKVYKISNAQTQTTLTATDITTGKGLPAGFISSIDVDPTDADNVFITFSNYEIKSIFNSTNGGQSWTDISGDLEENSDGSGAGSAVRWIHVFERTDDSKIYFVGTTTGLYSTESLNGTSTTWEREGEGTIGNVPVSMIRSRKVDGYVAVATHGKGMFSANIADSDEASPEITSLSPADDGTDISPSVNLKITFDEEVADGGGSVTIRNAEDDSVVEIFQVASLSIAGSEVTINPTADLTFSTSYYVEISNDAFIDSSDNAFAGIADKTVWNFTTSDEADTDAPNITSLTPADDETDISPDIDLKIRFDEEVADGGGSFTIRNEEDDSVVETFQVAGLSIAGSEVTINPAADLDFSTSYYLEISADAFIDTSNNPFAGIADMTVWNFTTSVKTDVDAPEIASLSPADDALDIDLGASLEIVFNEEIEIGDGNFIVRNRNDDSVIETISATSSNITINNETVSVELSVSLEASESYYILIDEGFFKDKMNNDFPGISDPEIWNFETILITSIFGKSLGNQVVVRSISNGINLKFLNPAVQKAEIDVYTLEGKIATHRAKATLRDSEVNLKADLTKGVYILLVRTDVGVYVQKFIIKEFK